MSGPVRVRTEATSEGRDLRSDAGRSSRRAGAFREPRRYRQSLRRTLSRSSEIGESVSKLLPADEWAERLELGILDPRPVVDLSDLGAAVDLAQTIRVSVTAGRDAREHLHHFALV